MVHGNVPPLAVLETWPTPNYTDPVTRGPAIIITSAILGTFTLLVIAARMYARFCVLKNVGIDDCLILIATPLMVGLLIAICLLTDSYHLNRHTWDIAYQDSVSQAKLAWVTEWLYVVTAGIIKLSVLAFFRRLTADSVTRTFKLVVWAAILGVLGFMFAFTFTLYFSCTPLEAYWKENDRAWDATHKFTCIQYGPVLLSTTIVSLVQDVIAAIIPMSLFWQLKIDLRQKLILGAIFAVGLFACGADGVRLYYLHKVLFETWDIAWYSWNIYLWSVIIVTLSMMCASAPSLKVFFIRAREKARSRTSSQKSNLASSRQQLGEKANTADSQAGLGTSLSKVVSYKVSAASSDLESGPASPNPIPDYGLVRADYVDENPLSDQEHQLRLEKEFRV